MSVKRFMVDIEGLGKMPGGVILSIGWVRFSPGVGPVEGTAGEIRLNIQDQLDKGLTLDVDTLNWWLEQPASPWAPGKLPTHPDPALFNFNAALAGADEVWAKPPSYDLMGVEAVMDKFGMKPSFHWRTYRCFRTLKGLAPSGLHLPRLEDGVKHGALADALHQAKEASAMLHHFSG